MDATWDACFSMPLDPHKYALVLNPDWLYLRVHIRWHRRSCFRTDFKPPAVTQVRVHTIDNQAIHVTLFVVRTHAIRGQEPSLSVADCGNMNFVAGISGLRWFIVQQLRLPVRNPEPDLPVDTFRKTVFATTAMKWRSPPTGYPAYDRAQKEHFHTTARSKLHIFPKQPFLYPPFCRMQTLNNACFLVSTEKCAAACRIPTGPMRIPCCVAKA